MPALDQRIAEMKAVVSRVAGVSVDVTIRGLRSFTFSAEGDSASRLNRLASIFGKECQVSCRYDAECDFTCLYVEVN